MHEKKLDLRCVYCIHLLLNESHLNCLDLQNHCLCLAFYVVSSFSSQPLSVIKAAGPMKHFFIIHSILPLYHWKNHKEVTWQGDMFNTTLMYQSQDLPCFLPCAFSFLTLSFSARAMLKFAHTEKLTDFLLPFLFQTSVRASFTKNCSPLSSQLLWKFLD